MLYLSAFAVTVVVVLLLIILAADWIWLVDRSEMLRARDAEIEDCA